MSFKATPRSSPDLQQIAPWVKKYAEFDVNTPGPSNHQQRHKNLILEFVIFIDLAKTVKINDSLPLEAEAEEETGKMCMFG